MGLAADVTRLCTEIVALRKDRGTFMKELAWEAKDRRNAVSEMRASISRARMEVARKTEANLQGFVSDLKRDVGGRRNEQRSDLAGAHQAWFGEAPVFEKQSPTKAPVTFEKRGTAEAPMKPEKKSKRKSA